MPRDTWPAVYEVKSVEEKPSSYILGSCVGGNQFTLMPGELLIRKTQDSILAGTKLLVFADPPSAYRFLLMHGRITAQGGNMGGFVSIKCPPTFGETCDLGAKEVFTPKAVLTKPQQRPEDLIWNCADGRILRLGEMTDLHLLNCLEGRHGSEEMRERMAKVLKNRSAGLRSAADGLDSRIDLALGKVKRNFEGFTSIPKERRGLDDGYPDSPHPW